ncbi:DNA-binding LytR/AlgR family response regulator [Microbacterium endophyticum]|uniref:DNA-binding LytR/AlgR family response regulator n=1 Tax=Microbacterium endophyticum TaxID=1526412 RepID=A0A7W4V1L3_9MICO|nr:LytTR family DNA-binding domain-containing protein [Microbacterium endophyticum]MBB2975196.1 DNA-binding LytR/AlgR family response regulator [Microbacterium endophyticum]NIK37592.1 DNA-binding LytR/AlgR family response regulator [Microbacterium endophyticum]
MIRVGVVEDDPASIDRLLSHLDRFQREQGEAFHVGAFRDGADILEDYRPDWDILFLDIQMERVDGMTAARRIREVDSEVIIVFVTSSPQYAVAGYEVDALSYLMKPVTYAAFAQELTRSLVRLRRRERRHLLFAAVDGDRHRVDIADILYIESVKHHVMIHTLDADHTVVTTLKAMESELADDGFFRCNSGYLVNLRHVTGVEGNDCRVRGGVRLQISRPRKKEFLAVLSAYISARGITT